MLESLRRQGASIFVYLIFCLLIAIFIINFRPGQTRSDDNGCTGESNPIIEVGDEKVSSAAWHVAYSGQQSFVERMVFGVVRNDPTIIGKDYWAKNLNVGIGPTGEPQYKPLTGKGKVHFALESLIRRELLAQEAEARGLKATDALLEDQVKQGSFFLAGERTIIPGIFQETQVTCTSDTECGKGSCGGGHCIYWNPDAWHGLLNELNVSKNSYYTEQKRSLLAWMMAKVLVDSVQVSRDEAYQQWLYERSTVTYDVVAFKPAVYAAALEISDADLDKWIAAHEADVKAKYTADERTYKNVPPQLHLREIFIAADKDKADAVGEAKKKLDDARAAITAGKTKFADAAKELNSDPELKGKSGDLEWRNAETPAIGEKAISNAVKTLKPGEMTPVVAGDKGVYLVTAEAKREGDLAYDTVKRDIAMDLARKDWGKEAAKRAALAALAGAHGLPGADLEKLYEKDTSSGGGNIDFQKLLNDPNVPDDVKKKIIEQKIMQQAPQHGWIDVPGADIPAGSYLQADGAGGGAATGSGPGSAGSAGSASSAIPAPAPDLTPTKEELPKLEPVKAMVTRYGPTPREKDMSGLDESADAKKAVFDELKPNEIASKIYEADGNYILVQLVARDIPEQSAFDKDADERIAQLRERRGMTFLDSWLRERCEALLAKNRILPNLGLLRETDDKGNVVQAQYRPCQSFH